MGYPPLGPGLARLLFLFVMKCCWLMRCSSCSNGWRLRSRTVIPVGGRNLLFGLGRSRPECGERGFEWGRSVTDLFDESGVYQCGECRRRFFCCGGGGSPGSGRGIEWMIFCGRSGCDSVRVHLERLIGRGCWSRPRCCRCLRLLRCGSGYVLLRLGAPRSCGWDDKRRRVVY
jgi:hypothetical protein